MVPIVAPHKLGRGVVTVVPATRPSRRLFAPGLIGGRGCGLLQSAGVGWYRTLFGTGPFSVPNIGVPDLGWCRTSSTLWASHLWRHRTLWVPCVHRCRYTVSASNGHPHERLSYTYTPGAVSWRAIPWWCRGAVSLPESEFGDVARRGAEPHRRPQVVNVWYATASDTMRPLPALTLPSSRWIGVVVPCARAHASLPHPGGHSGDRPQTTMAMISPPIRAEPQRWEKRMARGGVLTRVDSYSNSLVGLRSSAANSDRSVGASEAAIRVSVQLRGGAAGCVAHRVGSDFR